MRNSIFCFIVFEYEPSDSDFFKYKYTIQDDDLDSHCISAIACSKLEQKSQENDKTFYTLVTGSNKNLKVWTLQEILVISNNKNRKDQAKYLKMCKELSLNNDQEDFSDDDEERNEQNEKANNKAEENFDDSEENEDQKKKGYCLIQ
jgi:hypothetical protein